MKLCLGTVQFGIDYGLRGRSKPSLENSIAMLDYAVRNGVDAIDTSALYGEAESVVGEFLRHSPVSRDDLAVVSKFGVAGFDGLSSNELEHRLLDAAGESLARLGLNRLDAYICHVPSAVHDDRVVRALGELRRSGLADHVGFSVYETEEAETAINSGVVDFLQIPLSILDQRMVTRGILELASCRGVQLHSRSAYVQGLALMEPTAVPEHLAEIRPAIECLAELCRSANVSRQVLALAFVRSFKQISHLVFGVHDMDQLVDTMTSFSSDVPIEVIQAARSQFADIKPELVMPNKWKRRT